MDEPVVLPIGTGVSARYRGAFCEAKITKVAKCVKCKVLVKDNNVRYEVSDEDIRGPLKVGATVDVKKPSTGQYHEATLLRITDMSSYTVVFDDGDQNTLKRSKFCLKGKKHFTQTDTLDQLPLTHPEQFGTPVVRGGEKNKLSGAKKLAQTTDSNQSTGEEEEDEEEGDGDGEEEESAGSSKRQYAGRLGEMVGRVVVMEIEDRKKTAWLPVLVVQPSADNLQLPTKDHVLVRSFKDSKFYAVARNDTKEFSRDAALKNEDKALKPTLEKALVYVEKKELPQGWLKDVLLGRQHEQDTEEAPSEEKDMFVALLYKYLEDCGTPLNKAPTILDRDLDLFRLFRIVKDHGGYNRVTNLQKWNVVYTMMALPAATNAANQIKMAYKKYLHSFEDFYRKLGCTMGNTASKVQARNTPGRSLMPRRERDSFPKSPSNPALKKAAKDDEKDEPLADAPGDKAMDDSVLRGTPSIARSVEVVNKRDPSVANISSRGSSNAGLSSIKRAVALRGKVTAASSADEDEKQVKPLDTPRIAMKTRRRPGDNETEEVERKRRRRGDSECTAGDDTTASRGSEKVDTDDSESLEQACVLPHYPVGTRVRVRPRTEKNIYDAKITKVREGADGQVEYHVHYAGWNNRYDEWVSADHIEGVEGMTPGSGTKVASSGVKGKLHPSATKNYAANKSLITHHSALDRDARMGVRGARALTNADKAKMNRLQRLANGNHDGDNEPDASEPAPEDEEVASPAVSLRGRKDSSAMPQLTKEEPSPPAASVKLEGDVAGANSVAETPSQRQSIDTVCGESLPVLDTPLLSEDTVAEGVSAAASVKMEVDGEDIAVDGKRDEDEDSKPALTGSARKRSRRRRQSELLMAEGGGRPQLDSMDVLTAAASTAACEDDPITSQSPSEVVKKGKGGRNVGKNITAKVEVAACEVDKPKTSGEESSDSMSATRIVDCPAEVGLTPIQRLASVAAEQVLPSSGTEPSDVSCAKSEHNASIEVEALLRAAAMRDAACDSPSALEALSVASNGSGCNNSENGDAPPETSSRSRRAEGSSKQRRRRRKNSYKARVTAKNTHKHHAASDSDEDCDDPRSPGTLIKLASISPRPAKFNFVQCLDDMPLTAERRIELIMCQIGEMKKMYTHLKSKVLAIDRQRKRHRRERDTGDRSTTEAVYCS